MYQDILIALWNDGTIPLFILAAIVIVGLGFVLNWDLGRHE